LIKHTEKLLEEKEEKLCVKVLRTLREMMAIDSECGEKVANVLKLECLCVADVNVACYQWYSCVGLGIR
jgi:hypothetical protein